MITRPFHSKRKRGGLLLLMSLDNNEHNKGKITAMPKSIMYIGIYAEIYRALDFKFLET